tara:strand:- start:1632 stop:1862 length:231 start_codon:yes stop_codon:yes gene_type:complete
MTKLIDKPPTIPSEGTTNKRDKNFPFAILPKEKPSLQFSNKAIENYLPTFGKSRQINLNNKLEDLIKKRLNIIYNI